MTLETVPMTDATLKELKAIAEERIRQNRKWGEQNHQDLYWLGILMEEIGEVAKAIIESHPDHAQEELVQVAAVAVAWRECKKRGKQ